MPSPSPLPPLPRLDFDDPQMQRDPYAVYRRLREEAPVSVTSRKVLCDAVVVARHDDVVRVLKDDEAFANDVRVTPDYRPPPWWAPDIVRSFQDNMLGRDGAAHRRLRTLIHKAFTPARVAAMNAGIAALIDRLLDAAEARGGPIDLIHDLALPLPLAVVCDMLGVPEAERAMFRRRVPGVLDFETRGNLAMLKALLDMRGLLAFFRRLIALRRREPGPDLVSALIAAEVDGERLSEQELADMVFLLLLAGHETTVNLIGNGTLALLRHPDQLARLREDPALIDSALEELLRYDCPFHALAPRYTRKEVEIAGHRIPAGSHVIALIGSANHDPAHFPEPERLDLTRSPNKHLAFGFGLHYCVGAPLARSEGRAAFLALLRRYPGLRLAVPTDELRYRRSNTFRGLVALPLHLR